jgi:hypothetical protein
MTSVLPSDPNLRRGGHVLVVGVDGVRYDLLGPDTAPPLITRQDEVAPLVFTAAGCSGPG